MILQLLNWNLKQLAEISVLRSVSMERSYSGIGKFALHLHPQSPNAEKIEKDCILMPVRRARHAFLVQDIERGKDSLIIRGVQLKGVVQRRLCVPSLNVPSRLWKYSQGAWVEIVDKAIIRGLLDEEILQGYEKPIEVVEDLLWLDLNDVASVYNWDSKAKLGEVWLDLERAQVRNKYKNFGYDRITACAETAILHYLKANVVEPEDEGRKIAGVALSEDLQRGAVYPWQARFEKLDEVVKRISEATGIGWDMWLDLAHGKLMLGCVEGRDFTDPALGRVVTFSLEMGNAGDVKYKEQSSQAANVAYVGGSGEDENRMILAFAPKGEEIATGLARAEVWSEAGSTDDPAVAKLAAEKKLAEVGIKQSVTAEVLDSGALRYGRDWDVGDKVLVELKMARGKISKKLRISSVTETVETDQPRKLAVVFGDEALSIQGMVAQAGKIEVVR